MVARCSIVSASPFAVIVIVVMGVGTARADTFTHAASVKPEVRLSERAKPPPRRADTPAPPSADALLAVEVRLTTVRFDQIDVLRDLLARTPDDAVDEKADYYTRLGELYGKLQRMHRLQGAEDEIALGKATDGKRRAALAASAAAHRTAERAAMAAAVDAFRTLTDGSRFASYPRFDLALFIYADTLQHAGHPREARVIYDRLVKDYPGSRFVADAHLAFADAAFEAGQLEDAGAHYQKVLRFPSATFYQYAQYKLGWVLLGQRNYQDALERFFEVARATRQDGGRQVLYRAARHDFVRAYAEVGRADRALPAFTRIEPKQPLELFATLGGLYLDQGKYDKAIYVFRTLIEAEPRSAQVCAWQHAIARATLAAGTNGDKVQAIEQLVRLYTTLRDHHGLPAGEAAECHDAAAEMSGQLARAYHQEAVKTQNLEHLGHADRLYRVYLGAFGDAADFAETRYFHAELLWVRAELEHTPRLATQRWEDAANAFTEVAMAGKPGAPRVQVAADAAMQAWMKALAVDPRAHPEPAAPDAAASDQPPVPRPLPAPQQKLLAAYDLYLARVADGTDEQRIAVTFLKADLLRRFDHLAEAIPLFEELVARHPDHEAAEDAAQLALDSENRLGHDAAMLAFARGLSPAFLAAHPRVQTTVARLGHQALRKDAERLEAEARRTGNLATYVTCGERYLEIYNGAVEAPDIDELLYNAGVCFELGKSLGGAIRIFETLQQLAPKSPLAARALARLGNVYATTAQYREAAERLEAYAGKYAGEVDAYKTLSSAVQFRKGLGDDVQAIADTEAFVARFARQQPAAAAAAYFSLVAIYEKQGDLPRLARHLRAYLDRYGQAGGADRRVIAWGKLGDTLWRQACPVATVDGACVTVVRTATARAADPAAIPRRCGDASRLELTVVPRDGRAVRTAQAAFDTAIAEYEHAGTVTGDARGAQYAYALARFSRAERDYERYLALPIPGALDFDSRRPAIAARSHQRFDAWIAGKTDLAVKLRAQYQPLTTLGDAAIAIAAATRIAAISQNLSAQLYRAEIPANLRTGTYAEASSTAYCEALEQVAEPLEREALSYYQACLATSTRLGWFSEWSRICERELGQLQPDRFPSTLELRREPSAVACITQLEAAAR
jgi:tetratricopeptide (TPR) repeat protein